MVVDPLTTGLRLLDDAAWEDASGNGEAIMMAVAGRDSVLEELTGTGVSMLRH